MRRKRGEVEVGVRDFSLVKAPKASRLTPSWRVLPNRLYVSQAELVRLTRLGAAGGEIFNPDLLRHQAKLSRSDDAVTKLEKFLREDGALYRREQGPSNVLHSECGCLQQPWHADYAPAKLLGVRRKPQGVLWALEDGTRFMVAGPEGIAFEITLSAGEVLIFDGDLVHAGAAYPNCANTRVHMYLFVMGETRPLGGTWKVPSFNPSRVVQWTSGSTCHSDLS